MDKRQLERIAYHEVGHAVASYLAGIPFKRIEIYDPPKKMPNSFPLAVREIGKLGGRVLQSTRRKLPIATQIFVSLAGGVVESIRFKKTSRLESLYHCAPDLENFKEYFQSREDFDLCFDAVRSTLKIPAIWQAISRLAKELLIRQKISYREAIKIIGPEFKGLWVEVRINVTG